MRTLILLALLASGAFAQRRGAPPDYAPLPASEAEKRILGVLDEARRSGDVYLEVPVEDGRMLRLLTEAANAQTVVEIGTSTGYSGLWLCLGLLKTGGKLITHEIDPGRAAEARKHFEQAGVASRVTVIEGDAHKKVAGLKSPIDVVFIDADKEGYLDYLQKILPLVRPGGLILAHNIGPLRGYTDAVSTNPALETAYYMQGGGLSITLKKR